MTKARVDIAHEVRLAGEAEHEMDNHVAKVGQKGRKGNYIDFKTKWIGLDTGWT